MNSGAKHEYYKILELYRSVGGRKLLTNTDTGGQLRLDCSQDQNAQNHWK